MIAFFSVVLDYFLFLMQKCFFDNAFVYLSSFFGSMCIFVAVLLYFCFQFPVANLLLKF